MVTLVTSQLYSSNKDKRAVLFGKKTGITITDSYTDGIFINNIHLSLTTIGIYNEHATNSLNYRMYAHLDDNAEIAPVFDGTWIEIPKDNCEVTVGPQASKGETLTENWAWLLFRFKNTVAGSNATAQITLRSRQSRY